MLSFNQTNERQNLHKLIKQVNEENRPIEIVSTKSDDGVVLVSKKDCDAIQETLRLKSAGVIDRIKHLENEETESSGDIDWDTQ